MTIIAKILKASKSPDGTTIFSIQARYPRMILAEVNTHAMIAKSTSSSRAVPIKTMLKNIEQDPAMPIWTLNQSGMQGLTAPSEIIHKATEMAIFHMRQAMALVSSLADSDLNIHKQDANRYLEPWGHVDTILTATDWDNFFKVRCHKDAAPIMQELANAIKAAIENTSIQTLKLGEWHLPYVSEEEAISLEDKAPWVSAARCARVSYLLHDGTQPNAEKDMALAKSLFERGHMSPFEHMAVSSRPNIYRDARSRIRGQFAALRYLIETKQAEMP